MTTIHFCKLAIFGIFTSIYLTMVLNETAREVIDPMVLKRWRLENVGCYFGDDRLIEKISLGFSSPDPFTQEEGQRIIVLLTERAIKIYGAKCKLQSLFHPFPLENTDFKMSIRLFDFPGSPPDTLQSCLLENGKIRYFYRTPPRVPFRIVEESYEEARLAVLGDQEYTLEELDEMLPEAAGRYPEAWEEQMQQTQKEAGRRQQKRQRRAQRAR